MAQKDTTQTEFRTALELIQSIEDEISIQFCAVCTEIHGREYWSRHRERPSGVHECLTCRDRQIPQDEQATDADVREAVEDHTEDSA